VRKRQAFKSATAISAKFLMQSQALTTRFCLALILLFLVKHIATTDFNQAGEAMNTASSNSLSRTQALILAGGRGERLSPLTAFRSKPAIPFGGVFRIVDFTLSNCLNSGLNQVSLLTQYRHDELHSYIRQGWSECWNTPGHHGRSLICLPPTSGKRYRGTADAVFQNLPVIQSNEAENVLILSGDHVYEMDYRELLAQHVETNADVTIATIEHRSKMRRISVLLKWTETSESPDSRKSRWSLDRCLYGRKWRW
jgi:dTDP-glucose pyrophosphorylase